MLLCSVLTGFYGAVTTEVGVVMREKAVGWEVPQQRPNALRKRFQM